MLKKFLERRYSTRRINFKVCSGDLLIKSPNTNIRNTVGNLIKEVIKYEKFKPKDILAVIHLTDTDGCMIDEDVIEIVKDLKLKTKYELDKILVDSAEQKNRIIKRNILKKRNINKMLGVTEICKKYNYQLFYFSRHLELVFFNDINPVEENKSKNARLFARKDPSEFIKIFEEHLPPLEAKEYLEKYKESWDFIKLETNSLKRYTNFILLLEYLDSFIDNV
ncbi:MAG: hypothetical protein M0P10_09615 [Sphaerochaetaceae bacterium]|nr:hypothetical protein [Sphaerochaetaceae bacterium]